MPKRLEGHELLLNRGSRGSLWLADDHLLVIETARFLLSLKETYRRLDYSNIQAILHAPNKRGLGIALVIGLLLAACLILSGSMGADSRAALVIGGGGAVTAIVLLTIHFAKGPTTSLVVQTSIQPWRLKMVTRRSHAEQVIAALMPRCQQAQSDIVPVPVTGEGPGIPAPPPAPAADIDAPAAAVAPHSLATPAWCCMLAFGAMIAGETLWNSMILTVMMIGLAAAAFVLMIISLSHGGGTRATGGKGAFFTAVGTLTLDLVVGYAIGMASMMRDSMVADSPFAQTNTSMIRSLARFPTGAQDGTVTFIYVLAMLTAGVAVAGLFAVSRQQRLHRSSLQSVNPAES